MTDTPTPAMPETDPPTSSITGDTEHTTPFGAIMGPTGLPFRVSACSLCGAVVAFPPMHERWHAEAAPSDEGATGEVGE